MWLSNARFPTYKQAGCAVPRLYSERSARQAHPSAGVSERWPGGRIRPAPASVQPSSSGCLYVFKNREEYVTETTCGPDTSSPAGPALQGCCEGHHSAGQGLAQRKQARQSDACTQALVFSKINCHVTGSSFPLGEQLPLPSQKQQTNILMIIMDTRSFQ